MDVGEILGKARRKCLYLGLIEGIISSLALAALLLALYPLTGLALEILPLSAVPLFAILYRRIRRSRNDLYLARLIEREFPELEESLLSYLELRNRERSGYSSYLLELLEEDVKRKVRNISPGRAVKFDVNCLRAFGLGFLLLGLSLLGLTDRYIQRIYGLSPASYIAVHPGDALLFEDSTLVVRAELLGASGTPELNLDGKFRLEGQKVRKNLYSFKLRLEPGLHRYHIETENARSVTYNIDVVKRPYVEKTVAVLDYPDYTGMKGEKIEEPQYLMAVEGTRITFRGEVLNADSLFAEYPGGRRPVKRGSGRFKFTFELKEGGKLRFLAFKKGLRTYCAGDVFLDAVKDEPPYVAILEPRGEFNLGEDMRVPIMGYLEDDFGLKEARGIRIFEKDTLRFTVKSYEGGALLDTFSFIMDFSRLLLLPGDEIEFYIEGIDSKGQKALSSPLIIRVPTMEEIYAEAERASAQGEKTAGQLREKASELKKKMEEMEKLLKEEKNIDWSKKEELKKLLESQKETIKELENRLSELDQLMEKIASSPSLSPELLEKIQEVRQLFEEVMTEEMREALKKLEEALNRLNPQEIQKALSELKLNQEMMMENLERMSNILKRFKEESELLRLSEMAERLAEKQKDIEEEAKHKSPEELKETARKESQLRSEMEEFRKGLEELQKSLAESADSAFAESLALSAEQLQQLEKLAEQASGEMQGGNKPGAMKKMESVRKGLKKMSQHLLALHMNMSSMRMARLTEAIKKIRESSIFTSKRQEEVLSDWEKLDSRELAVREEGLRRAVEKTIKEYMDLMKQTLFASPRIAGLLSKARNEMLKAKESCENNRLGQGKRSAMRALESLNRAVVEMYNTQSCMNSSCSSTGLQEAMKSLAQMAQQQAAINQGTQSLIPLPTPVPQPTQEQLAQLAARQKAISQALQELSSSLNEEGLLRALEEAAKQAADIAKKMQEKRIDEKLLQEQQKLLTRLLEAQRSIRKREFTRKRESKPGKEFIARNPGPIKELQERERLRRALLEARREKIPAKMRKLIEAYFKTLLESR